MSIRPASTGASWRQARWDRSFTQGLLGVVGPGGGVNPSGLTIGYSNANQGIQATVQLLEQFGKTRVLSSPKLMALNNQTALLKVVENVVYFTIQSSISQGTPRRQPASPSPLRRRRSRSASSSA